MIEETIVTVEDDPDLLELTRHNLTKAGYRAIGHPTGEGAVDLIRRVSPALVILDIMLPGTDGREICRQMRIDPALANTPVIFLTALDSETDRVVGLEMGANDYVVKPFSVRELLARVRIHLKAAPRQTNSVLRSGRYNLTATPTP